MVGEWVALLLIPLIVIFTELLDPRSWNKMRSHDRIENFGHLIRAERILIGALAE
jgi:hypothetical protein